MKLDRKILRRMILNEIRAMTESSDDSKAEKLVLATRPANRSAKGKEDLVLDITDIKKIKLKEGDHICLLDNSNIEHILKDNNIISYELLTLMGDRLHRNY